MARSTRGMRRRVPVPRRACALTALALAFGLCCTSAADSRSVSGLIVIPSSASGPQLSYFKLTAVPGHGARAGTIELRNPTGRAVRVVLSPVDGQTIDTLGSGYAPPGSPAHQSARWLRLGQGASAGPGYVTLAPGQSAVLPVSVFVPTTALAGDYLSGVSVEALDQQAQTVKRRGVSIASVVRYAIGVEISIPGPRRPLIQFTGAQLRREPAGLTFLLDARNLGTAILKDVRGSALVTRGSHVIAQVPLGPGTFVTGTSIAYPILTPHEQPPQDTVYRVRASLQYAGGIARLDTLVRFGRAAALRQQVYGGPKAPSSSSGVPAWLVALASLLGIALVAGGVALLARRRRAGVRSPLRALEAAVKLSRETGAPLTLITITELAHGGYDPAELAPVLRSRLRHADRLCRLDGVGFLVVAPDTDLDTAEALADDLRRRVERARDGAGGVAIAVQAVDSRTSAIELLQGVRAAGDEAHALQPA